MGIFVLKHKNSKSTLEQYIFVFDGIENVEQLEPLNFDHQGNMGEWLIIEKCRMVWLGEVFRIIITA